MRLRGVVLKLLSRMLKKPPASYSHRSDPQRTPRVRLGPSLAAALLDGFFEHPARYFPVALDVQTVEFLPCKNGFPSACETRPSFPS